MRLGSGAHIVFIVILERLSEASCGRIVHSTFLNLVFGSFKNTKLIDFFTIIKIIRLFEMSIKHLLLPFLMLKEISLSFIFIVVMVEITIAHLDIFTSFGWIVWDEIDVSFHLGKVLVLLSVKHSFSGLMLLGVVGHPRWRQLSSLLRIKIEFLASGRSHKLVEGRVISIVADNRELCLAIISSINNVVVGKTQFSFLIFSEHWEMSLINIHSKKENSNKTKGKEPLLTLSDTFCPGSLNRFD